MKREDYISGATSLLEKLNDKNLDLIYRIIHRMWLKQE